jgi:predicted alpha/beta hydrolase
MLADSQYAPGDCKVHGNDCVSNVQRELRKTPAPRPVRAQGAGFLQEINIATAGGYEVPLEYFVAAQPIAKLLILPALGIEARLYRKLGAMLAQSGITVATLEQRGHGRSSLRPSRSCDFGFKEWLLQDIPAALNWLLSRESELPVYVAGHSLGGHLGLMARALYPDQVAGMVLLTTATPWYRCFRGRQRLMLRVLINAVPPVTALLGHYPGNRIGFGGREARRLMADWLEMARHNRYEARGFDADLESMVQAGSGPVLSIYCDRDDLAPLTAIEGVTKRLPGYEIDWFEISSDALGVRADHVSWAKQPALAAAAISEWIGKRN